MLVSKLPPCATEEHHGEPWVSAPDTEFNKFFAIMPKNWDGHIFLYLTLFHLQYCSHKCCHILTFWIIYFVVHFLVRCCKEGQICQFVDSPAHLRIELFSLKKLHFLGIWFHLFTLKSCSCNSEKYFIQFLKTKPSFFLVEIETILEL